jgi:hypothetical protein
MNMTRAKFTDLRVRQAVNHAVDKRRITESLLKGYCTPSDQPFREGMLGYAKGTRGSDESALGDEGSETFGPRPLGNCRVHDAIPQSRSYIPAYSCLAISCAPDFPCAARLGLESTQVFSNVIRVCGAREMENKI